MENYIKNMNKKYDRVMPRINNRSRSSIKSSSTVTRHDIPSSSRIGAKPSVSNIGSSVFSELPVVLNDYVPESNRDGSGKRTLVVKPRKTVKSLDPALSPHRSVKVSEPRKRDHNLLSQSSAPSVLFHEQEKWSHSHVDHCLTSRSHSKLKELKDEIKAYHNSDKLTRLRSHLYKSCGVVLDDVGHVAADKAVQVEELDAGNGEADKIR
ncbi:uncharacterized protein LOC119188446 [Manduca sexta]|nr:uncharacterized protein LOC119188446 [Manduca sexta]